MNGLRHMSKDFKRFLPKSSESAAIDVKALWLMRRRYPTGRPREKGGALVKDISNEADVTVTS